MPEFPEVYTIVKDLSKYLTNSTITSIQTISGYKIKSEFNEPQNIIINNKITKIHQIAKNIIFELQDYDLIFHLAMTGKLLIRSPNHTPDNHLRILFELFKNDKKIELRFTDVRMFGKAELVDKNHTKKLLLKTGPNVLYDNISSQLFNAIIKSKKTNIKNVLMDQEKIAGLGNVYATDALWISQIHPARPTQSITLEEAEKLLNACKEILQEGINNRGLTISDYVDAFGKPGKQQNFFRIYQRDVCKRCNNKSKTITINTRTTYFCPVCQQ